MVENELEDFISLNPEAQLSEEEKLYLRDPLSMQRSHSDRSLRLTFESAVMYPPRRALCGRLPVEKEKRAHLAVALYASYKKAWWHNQAGLMQGNFINATSDPPLQGRYNDGTVWCKIGEAEDGRPVYSNEPLPTLAARGCPEEIGTSIVTSVYCINSALRCRQ
ncbi:hypothetical protein DIPPA_01032 [Diplonema papillatum]|nr:hypothetical protein DIPPA_01032 [Diplonema papillatum]